VQRQFYTAEKITLKLNVLCAIYCLGPETKHTVYKGKIAGAIMAQELLHKQLSGFGHHVSMYVYIQASILATQTKACNPSHYLLNILHTKLTWNKRKFHNLGVTIRWIPSHLEIKGNKEADRQAKCAIKGNADTPINRLSRELCDRLLDS